MGILSGIFKARDKPENRTACSADDLEEEIEDAGDAADKSSGKFEKFGSILKGIGAAMGAVAVAAGAAAVSLGKEVVAAYADYDIVNIPLHFFFTKLLSCLPQ